MEFQPGTVIAGKYRVERLIGQGGMGVVLAARHLGLDEMVAVKFIRADRGVAPHTLARFQREARAAARLKSEHVSRVLDVDRLADGTPYIVMELIVGTDLHALLKRRVRLPVDVAVMYVTQACEGVAEAHALGMVHRDIKLKNLFLTKRRDGRHLIKVIDFGVVKVSAIADDLAKDGASLAPQTAKAREATLTGGAMLVGSVHYMAPEQILASNVVTAQADIWSLGVCLYAMITGALPFQGDTLADVCGAVQGRPPEDVTTLVPDIQPGLAAAIMRALEKDVRRRFADVAEFAAAIAPYGTDEAAPSRIETILDSSVRPSGALPGSMSHLEVAADAETATPGREESTRALGDLSTRTAPSDASEPTTEASVAGALASNPLPAKPSGASRVTALVLLVAAATLVASRLSAWTAGLTGSPVTDSPVSSATEVGPSPPTASSSADASSSVAASASDGGAPSAPARSSVAASTQRADSTQRLPPVKPLTRTPAPKPAASSPYDRF